MQQAGMRADPDRAVAIFVEAVRRGFRQNGAGDHARDVAALIDDDHAPRRCNPEATAPIAMNRVDVR